VLEKNLEKRRAVRVHEDIFVGKKVIFFSSVLVTFLFAGQTLGSVLEKNLEKRRARGGSNPARLVDESLVLPLSYHSDLVLLLRYQFIL